MKRIITLATVALMSFANIVGAMTLSDAQKEQIHRYAPMADIPILSDAQIHDLMAIIESNDSENRKRVRANLVVQRNGGLIWN